MNIDADMKKIESKMIREFFEDGLTELMLGLSFFWVWIVQYIDVNSDSVLITSLLVSTPFVFLNTITDIARKKLIYPRTGYVNQKKYGKRQVIQAVILTILALGILFLIVWVLGLKSGPVYQFFSKNIFLIFAVSSTSYLGIVGYLSGVKRVYLYAGLVGLIFVIAHFISIPLEIYILYFSLLLIANGFYLLIRFLRTHPVLEVPDEES